MSTILVTGSEGQLGKELKDCFAQSNHTIIYTDVADLDITNSKAVSEFIETNKPEYIINCAAYTAVDKAESDIDTCKLINSTAPGILAKAAKSVQANFIHVSTDYVFDGKSYIPYTEDMQTNPQSVYGATKLEGEINATKEYTNTVVIRTSWLYSSYANNFVKTMIRLGNERDTLSVIFDQVGTPTYAKDLALAIVAICNSEEFIPGIYHFSNEGACSWYDFAKEIHDLTKVNCNVVPIETKDYPTPAKRPHYSILNKSKIKTTYNLTIRHWKTALIECISKL